MPQISGMRGIRNGYGNDSVMSNENLMPMNTTTDAGTLDKGQDKSAELWQVRDGILAGPSFGIYRSLDISDFSDINQFLAYTDYEPHVYAFKMVTYVEVTLNNGRQFSKTLELELLGSEETISATKKLDQALKNTETVKEWYLGEDQNDNTKWYLDIKYYIGIRPTTGSTANVIPIQGETGNVVAVGLFASTRKEGSGSYPNAFGITKMRISSIGYGRNVHELNTDKKPTLEYDANADYYSIKEGMKDSGRYQPVFFDGRTFVPCFTIDTSGSLPAQPDSDTFYFVP